MPLDINQELINQMVQRQIAEERMADRFKPPVQETVRPTTMSPIMSGIFGPIADGLSTYAFLKGGTAKEMNPMFSGMGGPAATGLAVTGMGLAYPLLGKLLQNKLPQSIIDTIVGNQGNTMAAAAGSNFDGFREQSQDQVNRALKITGN